MILLFLLGSASAERLWGLGPLSSFSMTGQSDFRIRYRVTNRLEPNFEESHPRLHDHIEQIEKINILFDSKKTKIRFQFDQVSFMLNKYKLDGELKYSWNLLDSSVVSPFKDFYFIPEKVTLEHKIGRLDIGLGDVYASFGRGIALNVIQNTKVDIDTSIRGALFRYGADDWDLSVISGFTNKQQIMRFNPNLMINRDIPHFVGGTEFKRYGLLDGAVSVGTHAVVSAFGEDVNTSPLVRLEEGLDSAIGGMDVELSDVLGMDWYLEGDLFHYFDRKMQGEDGPWGYTVYGSASMYTDAAILLFEAKISKDSERINSYCNADQWEIATPPSLEYERVITEDSAAAVNSNDIVGGRINADIILDNSNVKPYVSVNFLRDTDLGGLHFNKVPETIVHPVVGIKYTPPGTLMMLNTGFRQDQRDGDNLQDRLFHLDGEYSKELSGGNGIELNVSMWSFWWGDTEHYDFLEMQNALVFRRGEHWDFTLYQDWSNNTQLTSKGNFTDELYGALEVQYKPTDSKAFRLLMGAYKAGIRCSGGQCRILPGFDGVELAYRQNF
ncbi:MAG: hypothetical protein VX278_04710 [Myxococcota bacterium]|nr:hypothetical protein [Myxococcota bacterium]